jgi:hypothetical protein
VHFIQHHPLLSTLPQKLFWLISHTIWHLKQSVQNSLNSFLCTTSIIWILYRILSDVKFFTFITGPDHGIDVTVVQSGPMATRFQDNLPKLNAFKFYSTLPTFFTLNLTLSLCLFYFETIVFWFRFDSINSGCCCTFVNKQCWTNCDTWCESLHCFGTSFCSRFGFEHSVSYHLLGTISL